MNDKEFGMQVDAVNPDESRYIGISHEAMTDEGPVRTTMYVDAQMSDASFAIINQVREAQGFLPYTRLTPEQVRSFNHPLTMQKPETLRSIGRKLLGRVQKLKNQ